MDFTRKTYPHFHQAAIATALTLSVLSPAAWSAECSEYPAAPLTVNITGESDNFCDDQVSLREAIIYANDYLVGKDAITFTSALKGKTIEAVDGQFVVNESINIIGIDDAELITLKANNEAPLFSIESSADKIDFDLSNVILEKSGGANHLIEMNGYGGDVNLDNIHTTENTRGGGVFKSSPSYDENDHSLKFSLNNSKIENSDFDNYFIRSSLSRPQQGSIDIRIENTKILNTNAEYLAYSYYGNKISTLIENTHIEGGEWPQGLFHSYTGYGAVERNSSLIIKDSSIRNLHSSDLAYIGGSSLDEGEIKLERSIITGNTLDKITNASSYNAGSATVNISDSTISNNIINSDGINSISAINIERSELCENTIEDEGDTSLISTTTNMTISDSTICNNKLRAIKSYTRGYKINATTKVVNTNIYNNESTAEGAGIYVLSFDDSTNHIEIIDSTINNNSSQNMGGAIYAKASGGASLNLDLINSTISKNTVEDKGLTENSEDIFGGGIAVIKSSGHMNLNINHSSIIQNTSTGYGGGIGFKNYSDNGGINISNSIVAQNYSSNNSDHDLLGEFAVQNSLIQNTSTNFESKINNILSNKIGTEVGKIPDINNNIFGVDPLLQDLTLSGNSWVHQLSADSPAIAAGNASADNLPEFDQRGVGFARVRTGNGVSELDLGAVQYFANPVAVNDFFSVLPNSENNIIDILNNDAQNSRSLPLDAVTIIIYPENGDAEVQQDGTILYTPNADFLGKDSLIYMMQDIDGNNSAEATVSITVSESSGGSGGTLNLWVLSLLALFGLRRKV